MKDSNNDERNIKLLKEEVDATINFDHKHIVKYYEFSENSTMTKKNGVKVPVAFIAQEPVLNGDLFDYISSTGPFSDEVCRYYFKQLLKGIHYIHTKGYSHRDLKTENVVLDHNFDIKILDFGFSAPLTGRDGSGFNTSYRGT